MAGCVGGSWPVAQRGIGRTVVGMEWPREVAQRGPGRGVEEREWDGWSHNVSGRPGVRVRQIAAIVARILKYCSSVSTSEVTPPLGIRSAMASWNAFSKSAALARIWCWPATYI